MASIRANAGKLFWDFRYRGQRCREYTLLPDTPENRRKMEKVLRRIEAEIEASTFDYRKFFPDSRVALKLEQDAVAAVPAASLRPVAAMAATAATPLFRDFANIWFDELSVGWRRTYIATVRQILDKHLFPEFGEREVGGIRREDILAFRSRLAKVRGRKEETTLSPRRINAVVLVLRQVLDEAADRFGLTTPRIKPLKVKRTDVQPFTLEEVNLLLDKARPDYRSYLTARIFTGMRTSEVDGLKWKYVDFERRLILIREVFVAGEQEADTKTSLSHRDIRMSAPVLAALQAQRQATGSLSEYVFCNRQGQPLDANNFTKRVWYPLLRHLKLALRRPYQMRHTCATLWLAAGESPQWIASQLGHATTEMLFRVYARFVPNLTRQDGSAFERLLLQNMPPLGNAAGNGTSISHMEDRP